MLLDDEHDRMAWVTAREALRLPLVPYTRTVFRRLA
jgi:hypothetical protein